MFCFGVFQNSGVDFRVGFLKVEDADEGYSERAETRALVWRVKCPTSTKSSI